MELDRALSDARAQLAETTWVWVKETVRIPQAAVGMVIGTKGVTVKQLQDQSCAWIELQVRAAHGFQSPLARRGSG